MPAAPPYGVLLVSGGMTHQENYGPGFAADPRARGELDLAVVGDELAGDDAKERGLAGAVTADEPDAGAPGDGRRSLVEELSPADREGDVADAEHGARYSRGAREAASRGFVRSPYEAARSAA